MYKDEYHGNTMEYYESRGRLFSALDDNIAGICSSAIRRFTSIGPKNKITAKIIDSWL